MVAMKLRMLRIDRGLSQYALAQAVGVHHATIARLEEGELPTARVALALAEFYGTKPSELWPALIEDREPAA